MAYQDDIQALNPVFYYRLNDTSAATCTATVGTNSSYNADDTSDFSFEQGDLLTGGDGDSVAKDHSNNAYMQSPSSGIDTDADYSFTIIYKTPSSLDIGSMISQTTTVPNTSYLSIFRVEYDSGYKFSYRGGTNIKGVTTLSADTIYHIVVTVSVSGGNHTWTLYMDGAEDVSLTNPSWYVTTNMPTERINLFDAGGASGSLKGQFQEFAWFDKELSAAEVQTLYDSFTGLTPVSNTLDLRWDIDGLTAVNNTLALVWNNEGVVEPTGEYEPFVQSLSPRRWYKCDEIDTSGGEPYELTDYGSDGTNATIPYGPNSTVEEKLVLQSPVGSKSIEPETNGYIKVSSLFNTNTYTVNFWIKDWPSSAGDKYIFASDDGTTTGRRIFIDTNTDEIQLYYSASTSPFEINTGARMVTLRSDNGTNELFVDGRPCNVANNTGTTTLLNAFFGSDQSGNNRPTGAKFDEILIFDSVLTDAEIYKLFAYSVSGGINLTHTDTITAMAPKAHWRLGESSGTTATDETGLHNLTYNSTNAPTYSVASLDARDSDTCVSSTYEIASADVGAMVNTGRDWSVSLIVSPSAQNAFCDILTLPGEGGSNEFCIYSSTDGSHETLNFGEPTDWGRKGASPTYSNGEIYHIVVRWDQAAGSYEAFLNGVELTLSATGTRTYPASGDVYIGNSGNDDYPFAGKIDEVAVFDYKISDAQIQELYQTMSTTLISNTLELISGIISNDYLNHLKVQWNVDESDGDVIVDQYGKRATGTE